MVFRREAHARLGGSPPSYVGYNAASRGKPQSRKDQNMKPRTTIFRKAPIYREDVYPYIVIFRFKNPHLERKSIPYEQIDLQALISVVMNS